MSLFHELKRRNVLRVGAAYVVLAWLVIQARQKGRTEGLVESYGDKAIALNEGGLSQWYPDPLYRPFHNDPRWEAFLERVGSSPEQLDAIEFQVTLPKQGGREKFFHEMLKAASG